MIVAEKNNNIFGYMILLKKNKNLIIDLIAIDKKYRNKGYGSKINKFDFKFQANKVP